MTHDVLTTWAITVHFAILSGALVAWYKYGDRSEVLAKSLEGTNFTLSKLQMMITSELLTTIKTMIQSVPSNPQPILGANGEASIYSERSMNFLESERFHQAIQDFVNRKTDAISDYRVFVRARVSWCFWAKTLSWTVLLVIVLQILAIILHGFFDKILGKTMPDWSIHSSLAVTALLVIFVFCVVCPKLLRNHDIIIQQKVKYDEL